MIEKLTIGLFAFALGYLARGWLLERRFAAWGARWQRQVDTLQRQLGRERTRVRELEDELGRSPAPIPRGGTTVTSA